MVPELLDFFGHVGYLFIGLGIILLARKNILGWISRAVGEAVWLGIGFALGMSSIWIWSSLFLLMEGYGFWSWRQERKTKSRQLIPMWAEKGQDYAIGYMDLVDFQFELGGALDGNKVYPSIEDLTQNRPCTEECGIVEVEIRGRKIILPSKF